MKGMEIKMNKTLSFVRLDFITIKPYLKLKNLAILFIIAIFMSINDTSSSGTIGFIMAFALIFSSYPFVIAEKNNLDALYATLPMKKETIVSGRYIFFFVLDILSGVAACVISFILQTVMNREFNIREALLFTSGIFAIYSFFQMIQLPIYFKLGYTKAKFLVYLPIIAVPIIVTSISSLLNLDLMIFVNDFIMWVSENQFLAVSTAVLSWLTLAALSYKLSSAFCKKV